MTVPGSLCSIAIRPKAISYATFDPAQTSANITLSGGNLTASAAGTLSSPRSTLGSKSFPSSGKTYWEITVTNKGSANVQLGVGTSPKTADGSNLVASATAWAYLSSNGYMYNANSTVGTGSPGVISNGDVMSFAYDQANSTLYAYQNNSIKWTVTGVTGTLYPAVTMGDSAVVTANFGASAFTYSPPAGYTGLS